MSGVLNIRTLAPGSSRHLFKLSASELQLGSSDIVDFIGCDVTLDIDRTSGDIVVRGQAAATLKLECARCLEPFEVTKVHDFAFVIKTVRKGEHDDDMAESTDDYIIVPESTEEFDITPMVRERILLSLPMKPLCSEACKGLCPKCGVNRNVETCDCSEDEIDERWSGLMKLKQQHGGN